MDYIFFIPGVILLSTVALKLPSIKDTWRDPEMIASMSVLSVGGIVCVLSAPPTITVVNRLTGIPNFSAPLVYSGLSALSAGYLLLMIAWRGASRRAWHASRLVMGVYGLVIIGIVILFSLANVPIERTRDLDTYYANTPFMREMIVLYLVAHTAATLTLTWMCLTWLREVTGLTRTGLRLIVIGGVFDLSYQAAKYTAMAARWNGRNWDFLSTSLSPPLVAVAGGMVAAGFALPRVGPSTTDNYRAWRRLRLLKPLWAELRTLRAPAPADTHWWDLPVVRLAQRELAILDGVLACAEYLDEAVREAAYDEAAAQTHRQDQSAASREVWRPLLERLREARHTILESPKAHHPTAREGNEGEVPMANAEIVAEAAMLAAARVCVSSSDNRAVPFPSRTGTLDSVRDPHLMVVLARALTNSPIVARARQRAGRQAVGHD